MKSLYYYLNLFKLYLNKWNVFITWLLKDEPPHEYIVGFNQRAGSLRYKSLVPGKTLVIKHLWFILKSTFHVSHVPPCIQVMRVLLNINTAVPCVSKVEEQTKHTCGVWMVAGLSSLTWPESDWLDSGWGCTPVVTCRIAVE